MEDIKNLVAMKKEVLLPHLPFVDEMLVKVKSSVHEARWQLMRDAIMSDKKLTMQQITKLNETIVNLKQKMNMDTLPPAPKALPVESRDPRKQAAKMRTDSIYFPSEAPVQVEQIMPQFTLPAPPPPQPHNRENNQSRVASTTREDYHHKNTTKSSHDSDYHHRSSSSSSSSYKHTKKRYRSRSRSRTPPPSRHDSYKPTSSNLTKDYYGAYSSSSKTYNNTSYKKTRRSNSPPPVPKQYPSGKINPKQYRRRDSIAVFPGGPYKSDRNHYQQQQHYQQQPQHSRYKDFKNYNNSSSADTHPKFQAASSKSSISVFKNEAEPHNFKEESANQQQQQQQPQQQEQLNYSPASDSLEFIRNFKIPKKMTKNEQPAETISKEEVPAAKDIPNIGEQPNETGNIAEDNNIIKQLKEIFAVGKTSPTDLILKIKDIIEPEVKSDTTGKSPVTEQPQQTKDVPVKLPIRRKSVSAKTAAAVSEAAKPKDIPVVVAKKRGRPKGSKNKVVPVLEDSVSSSDDEPIAKSAKKSTGKTHDVVKPTSKQPTPPKPAAAPKVIIKAVEAAPVEIVAPVKKAPYVRRKLTEIDKLHMDIEKSFDRDAISNLLQKTTTGRTCNLTKNNTDANTSTVVLTDQQLFIKYKLKAFNIVLTRLTKDQIAKKDHAPVQTEKTQKKPEIQQKQTFPVIVTKSVSKKDHDPVQNEKTQKKPELQQKQIFPVIIIKPPPKPIMPVIPPSSSSSLKRTYSTIDTQAQQQADVVKPKVKLRPRSYSVCSKLALKKQQKLAVNPPVRARSYSIHGKKPEGEQQLIRQLSKDQQQQEVVMPKIKSEPEETSAVACEKQLEEHRLVVAQPMKKAVPYHPRPVIVPLANSISFKVNAISNSSKSQISIPESLRRQQIIIQPASKGGLKIDLEKESQLVGSITQPADNGHNDNAWEDIGENKKQKKPVTVNINTLFNWMCLQNPDVKFLQQTYRPKHPQRNDRDNVKPFLKIRSLPGDLLSKPLSNTQNIIPMSIPNDEISSTVAAPNRKDLFRPWLFDEPRTMEKMPNEEVLKRNYLTALFKCMASTCTFSTGRRDEFVEHVFGHEDDKENHYLWCSYCLYVAENPTALADHLLEEHRSSNYQCSYCFYRSVEPVNVIDNHHKQFHKGEAAIMMQTAATEMRSPNMMMNIKQLMVRNVPPLICMFCKEKFYVIKFFNEHMTRCKNASATTRLRCLKCNRDSTKGNIINDHIFKCYDNNFGIYHCVYCCYGTCQLEDLYNHFAVKHPSRVCYFSERSLSTEIPTNKKIEPSSVETLSLKNFVRPLHKDCKILVTYATEIMEKKKPLPPFPAAAATSTGLMIKSVVSLHDGLME